MNMQVYFAFMEHLTCYLHLYLMIDEYASLLWIDEYAFDLLYASVFNDS